MRQPGPRARRCQPTWSQQGFPKPAPERINNAHSFLNRLPPSLSRGVRIKMQTSIAAQRCASRFPSRLSDWTSYAATSVHFQQLDSDPDCRVQGIEKIALTEAGSSAPPRTLSPLQVLLTWKWIQVTRTRKNHGTCRITPDTSSVFSDEENSCFLYTCSRQISLSWPARLAKTPSTLDTTVLTSADLLLISSESARHARRGSLSSLPTFS